MISALRQLWHCYLCESCLDGRTIYLPATDTLRAAHLPTYRLRPLRRMAGRV